jgi:3-oxoacyl-[acyl-carrier protein] reductase
MRIALVTGAARGIGRAVAERLLRDGYGLVASDILTEGLQELEHLAPDRVKAIHQDIGTDDAPEQAMDAALGRFGRLDVLVNNAGIGQAKPVLDTTDEHLDRFLDINIRAQFRFARAALRVMQPGAAIVNIASIFGTRGNAGVGPYAMTKAAIIGLTHQLAAEHGPRGIRVNAVSPGLIVTELTRERIASNRRFQRQVVETTPFPRLGTPEDVAGAVAFLASPEDAGFVSGHVLVVDGGWLTANALQDEPKQEIGG